MSAPFPWQREAWTRWQRALEADRLAHALLVCGRPGTGAAELASAFCQSALCTARQADGTACGACRGCTLMRAQSHPDFLALVPEEEGKAILIDQIRQLGEFFALTSHYGGLKIALIEPADALNRAAANALLKILEEPPAGALLILVAGRPERLPATVRSRCQRVPLDRVPHAQALAWLAGILPGTSSAEAAARLAATAGAPLLAAAVGEQARQALDAIREEMGRVAAEPHRVYAAAAACEKIGVSATADVMLHAAHELALARVGAGLPAARAVATAGPGLIERVNRLHSGSIFTFQQAILEVKAQALSSVALRDIDLLELLWIAWAEAACATPGGVPRTG